MNTVEKTDLTKCKDCQIKDECPLDNTSNTFYCPVNPDDDVVLRPDIRTGTDNREKKIKKISTTIKRIWLDPILWGVKTTELKEYNKHWERLISFIGDYGTGECRITFLCGRKVYKYWVLKVECRNKNANIDGKRCRPHWHIALHGRACTQPAAGYCYHRDIKLNKNLEDVPFCRASSECPLEEE